MTVTSASPISNTSEDAQLLDTIERWTMRELKPIVREAHHRTVSDNCRRADERARTLRGERSARSTAGSAFRRSTYSKMIMIISSVWMSVTGIINSHLMLALAIEKFGTPEQKRQNGYPRSLSGEVRGGLALTEPDAGTDLQGIRMTARRDGGDYVINGSKTWITNGAEGSVLCPARQNRSPRPSRATKA